MALISAYPMVIRHIAIMVIVLIIALTTAHTIVLIIAAINLTTGMATGITVGEVAIKEGIAVAGVAEVLAG